MPMQAQCDLDFSFVNTGTNFTAFFTPPAASGIYSELGSGTIGAFFINESGSYVCGASSEFTGSQIQLAVMGDDSTTDEKDGFNAGEEITWFYQTASGDVYTLSLTPADAFTANGMSFISSYSTLMNDCGGGDTNDDACSFDFNYVNTGSNMTAFFTPPTASAIFGELGAGTVGAFFVEGEMHVCAASAEFSGAPVQLAVMGDDSTTDEKDGFNAGEEILWIYQTSEGTAYSLALTPSDSYTTNGSSMITGYTATEISCGVDVEGCTDDMYVEYNPHANIDDGSCATIAVYGCTDVAYLEYDANANVDDGSCSTMIFEGCMDDMYLEYNPNATVDDGSCATIAVYGCTDSAYLEYDANANVDDGSCSTMIVEGCMDDMYLEYNPNATLDNGSCETLAVYGCTDAAYLEYDANANVDDGSCATMIVEGCMDSNYVEYDSNANVDNGSCTTLVVEGCPDMNATNYDPNANTNDGSCEYDLIGAGCSVSFDVVNTGSNATIMVPGSLETPLSNGDVIGVFFIAEDGTAICAGSSVWTGNTMQIVAFGDDTTTDEVDGLSAGVSYLFLAQSGDDVFVVDASFQSPSMEQYVANGISFVSGFDFELACTVENFGCTDEAACNFDANANTNDGSCEYPEEYYNCANECVNDVDADGVCDEMEIYGCTDASASNYNANATEENGSCISWEEAYESCVESGGDDGVTQEDVDEVQALLDEANTALGSANLYIEDLEMQLSDALNNQDGVSQEEYDALQTELADALNEIDFLNSIINNLENDLNFALDNQEDGVTQADVDAVQEQLNNANNQISILSADNNQLEQDLSIALANVDVTQEQLNSANANLANAQMEIADLQMQLEEALANTGGSCDPIYVDLLQGWNIIGYTLPFTQDVAATMSDVVEQVQIVKNNAAEVYWPEYGFNGIGDYIPGQGYQIRMHNALNGYTFPDVGGQRLEMIPTVPAWVHELPIMNHPNDARSLVKVVNMLGQEVNPDDQFKGDILLYLYSDGVTEKRVVE